MTERANFVFTVKESAGGRAWVMAEPSDHKGSELFGDGFLGFDLADSATYEDASKLANYLNDNVETISLTRP